jgi:hypothetical protein
MNTKFFSLKKKNCADIYLVLRDEPVRKKILFTTFYLISL